MPTQSRNSDTQEDVNRLSVAGRFDPELAKTYFTLASGEVFVVPTSMLRPAVAGQAAVERLSESHQTEAEQHVIPVLEEHLVLGKRVVEREKVRIRKVIEDHVEEGDVSLTAVAWNVEHVSIGRPVAQRPEIRQEGETTVYPIVEEQMIVTRQLVLKEEIRVTRQLITTTERVSQVLRRERVEVERLPTSSETPA